MAAEQSLVRWHGWTEPMDDEERGTEGEAEDSKSHASTLRRISSQT